MPQQLEGVPTRRNAPSFSLRHRLFRATWNTIWLVLAAWTPPPLFGWRRLLLGAFGARLARDARVYGSARVWYPPNLEMGDGSVLARGVNCYCMDRVTLGRDVVVSQGTQLCCGTHRIDDPAFPLVTRPIVIGDSAWIAAEAFVGPGVTVGTGAVLGARGVAFSDLEPWTVYAGNPAKPLRRRQASGAAADP